MTKADDCSCGSRGEAPAALVGIAVDVSGSMQQSIQNREGRTISRFRGFRHAVAKVVENSRLTAQSIVSGTTEGAPEAMVFAYAFGMTVDPAVVDLLSLIKAAENVVTPEEIKRMKERYAAQYRSRYSGYEGLGGLARSFGFGDLVDRAAQSVRVSAEEAIRQQIKHELLGRVHQRLDGFGDTTLSVSELAGLWAGQSQSFEQTEDFIFGSTPMRQCLEQVAARFEREIRRLPPNTERFLVLISDGEPTDGDPLKALDTIKSLGVFVTTCFVTSSDVTKPLHLYARVSDSWPPAARLMFQAASVVHDDLMFGELLEGRGWTVEQQARLFLQVNQSETLEEFLSAAFSRTQGWLTVSPRER